MSQQQNPGTNDDSIPKEKSKMGRLFSRFQRKASQAMMVGAVKFKIKMSGNASPINSDVEAALSRLKSTKNEIYGLSDILRNLYDAKMTELKYSNELSNALLKLNNEYNDDIFNEYLIKIGKIYEILQNISNKYIKKFDELLLSSITDFRDKAIDSAQNLKLRWKTRKADYDKQLNNILKAKDKGDIGKQSEFELKRDAALKELNITRQALVKSVNIIQQKKKEY